MRVTYKSRGKGHDTGVGHEHVEARFFRQNLVCGFLDGSEIGVVAADPFYLGGTFSAGFDAVDGLLSGCLISTDDVDLDWVAARQHLSCSSSEAIGSCSIWSVRATPERRASGMHGPGNAYHR